jgi:hypothetical protein
MKPTLNGDGASFIHGRSTEGALRDAVTMHVADAADIVEALVARLDAKAARRAAKKEGTS